MPTTYSPSLKLAILGNGENVGTWGTLTNTNLGTLLEQAITGVQTITMANANYTLTNADGALSEARNAVLNIVGTNTAIRDIVAPLNEKLYIIANNTTGGFAIRILGTSGAAVTVANGATVCVYCNGTNFVQGLNNVQVAAGANITVTTVGDTTTIAGTAPASIPAGSVMAFYNATTPTGWTRITTYTNHMMRITNASWGTAGGTDSPILMNKVPSHTHGVTGNTGTESAPHSHNDNGHQHIINSVLGAGVGFGVGTARGESSNASAVGYASLTTETASHTHNQGTLTAVANAGAANWAPLYTNWMMCSKNP
jgi:hypothetical protein